MTFYKDKNKSNYCLYHYYLELCPIFVQFCLHGRILVVQLLRSWENVPIFPPRASEAQLGVINIYLLRR